MHPSTFDYHKPTDGQLWLMRKCREEAQLYAEFLNDALEDGPDKTYVLRKLREVAMWVNTAITRFPDGSPRP